LHGIFDDHRYGEESDYKGGDDCREQDGH
jgi:hypothetical protein